MGKAPGNLHGRRSPGRTRISFFLPFSLLKNFLDLISVGPLRMHVWNRRLPSGEGFRCRGKEFHEAFDVCQSFRFNGQPSLIQPAAFLDRRGKAGVVPGDGLVSDPRVEGPVSQGDNSLRRFYGSRAMFVRLITVNAIPYALGFFNDLYLFPGIFVPWTKGEPIGFGQSRGPEKVEIHWEDGTTFVTHPAVEATHHFP